MAALLYTLLNGRGSIGMAYNSNTLYLFYGYGCEYSLSHLAGYMKDKGYNVLELDLLKIKNAYDILSGIRGKPVVFTTSWHLFFDKRNFDYFIHGDENTQVLSPLEIIDFFKPIRSIYYPHDLTEFMHEQEWTWLDLFDMAMVPYKNNDYYLMKRYTGVIETGWINKTRHISKPDYETDDLRIVYFPSNTAYIKSFSPEQYFKILEPLLETGLQVKFPKIGGLDAYQKILADNDVELIDSDKTVFDLIDSYHIVVATGSSSVLYEAGLSGRPVITVLDGAMPDERYCEILPDYSWLYKCNIKEAARLIEDVKNGRMVLSSGEDILKPMDFGLAEKVITGSL
jgi:hypothetical protein